eukprot:2017158-Amphidinium_carterae.1
MPVTPSRVEIASCMRCAPIGRGSPIHSDTLEPLPMLYPVCQESTSRRRSAENLERCIGAT